MQKILVLKHGALGDIIQGMDAFESLRTSFPTAHITLLTTPAFAPLLGASGWFDEVFTDPRKPIWHIINTLRLITLFKQPFDAIIDLQCSARTAAYFKFTRPTARWFGTVQGCSDPMPDFSGVHNRDRMMVAAVMAGAQEHIASLKFLSAGQDKSDIKWPERYSVFVAGSSKAKPSKRWPAAHFADIAARSLDAGIVPILCGTAEDKSANDAIKSACPAVMDMTAQTSLSSLARLMGGAEFILGNDTGPVFLGARTDVPTCMLMGADTDPSMSAPTGLRAHYIYAEKLADLSADRVWEKLSEMRATAKTPPLS